MEVEGCIRRGVSRRDRRTIFSPRWKASPLTHSTNPMPRPTPRSAYQTAYMKCHYPKEFMAALLTSVLDNANKVAGYIEECSNTGYSGSAA